jgi:serine/threonine-protein kinase HipA
VSDADGEPGLLITRFDRIPGDAAPLALASEDACQALDLWPADKYNTSMEDAANALVSLTKARPIAARSILRQLIFAWLTGNGDLHSKNLSVLEFGPAEVTISPAYDLPSTLFYGDDILALTVAGRDTLSATRLRGFGNHLGLPRPVIDRTLGEVLAGTVDLSERIAAGALPFDARVNAKVARQLAIRRRDLSEGL